MVLSAMVVKLVDRVIAETAPAAYRVESIPDTNQMADNIEFQMRTLS